ncbi:MAG: C40 family peptidase [Oscillospiraceae bacterium]|nr:C40 family peptidase [Oscillospiraceae bacterium]
MPEFKERIKTDKTKAKLSSVIPPKQVARLMKEKYRQQLSRNRDEASSETSYAVDQIEGVGRWGTDKAASVVSQPRQRSKKPMKERFYLESAKRGEATNEQQQSNVERESPRLSSAKVRATQSQANSRSAGVFRERTRTIFKIRSRLPASKPAASSLKIKPPAAEAVKEATHQTIQRQMIQRIVAQAQKTAKVAMNITQRATDMVVCAVASLVSPLVWLLGGGSLLAILLQVAAIAAVASSPFGIFFSGEGETGGSNIQALSVSEAVGSINAAYSAKLEQLQAGDYDSITLSGQAADWPDVLAVFASRYAAAEDGVDVVTLDADRVSKLSAVFWDMSAITTEVETIDHSDSDPDDDIDDSWTECILHITVTAKTATDMKVAYAFTDYQTGALDELLSDRVALESLAGSLEITNADVRAVLNALPIDLSDDRKKAVETALQLVGKVNYFWGGKSEAIGWDSRWGQLAKVAAAGDSTTDTYRPYGLDCTGFIDWVLRNAGLPSDKHWYVGTNLTEITQAEALPGDMALNADASHIGMVVGRDSVGRLLICHCSSGANNVVVTEFTTSGFTDLGRPAIYGL